MFRESVELHCSAGDMSLCVKLSCITEISSVLLCISH